MGVTKAVLLDFDGVLSHGRFYEPGLSSEHPDATAWLQAHFFVSGNETVKRWMRGGLSFREVHARLEKETGVSAKELDDLLIESLRTFKFNQELIEMVDLLRASGVKTAIVTDNMDVFTRYVVPFHHLGQHFDAIVNSSDYGCLKEDDGGRLFQIAVARCGISDIRQTLLVDDTLRKIEMFRGLGGQAHHFTENRFLDFASLRSE